MKTIIKILVFFVSVSMLAQQSSTSAELVKKGLEDKERQTKNSLVKNLAFTNIGPNIMSGRVADIDVNPNDPSEFYVGYASGGLWYTKNNGTTFEAILENKH